MFRIDINYSGNKQRFEIKCKPILKESLICVYFHHSVCPSNRVVPTPEGLSL